MTDENDIQDEVENIDVQTYWEEDIKPQLEDTNTAAEGAIAARFVETVCEQHAAGHVDSLTMDSVFSAFAGVADGIKKKTLETKRDEVLDAYDLQENSSDADGFDPSDVDGIPTSEDDMLTADGLVKHYLQHVTKYEPQDASAEASYEWKFGGFRDEMDVEEPIVFETTSQHLATNHFTQEFSNHGGFAVSSSLSDEISINWDTWLTAYMDWMENNDMMTIEAIDGERTWAVEDLRSRLNGMKATDDLATAVRNRILYMESEDDDTLYVPNEITNRVTQKYENIDPQVLQKEMTSRNLLRGSVDDTHWINGSEVRLWQVDAEWVDVDFESGEGDDDE